MKPSLYTRKFIAPKPKKSQKTTRRSHDSYTCPCNACSTVRCWNSRSWLRTINNNLAFAA